MMHSTANHPDENQYWAHLGGLTSPPQWSMQTKWLLESYTKIQDSCPFLWVFPLMLSGIQWRKSAGNLQNRKMTKWIVMKLNLREMRNALQAATRSAVVHLCPWAQGFTNSHAPTYSNKQFGYVCLGLGKCLSPKHTELRHEKTEHRASYNFPHLSFGGFSEMWNPWICSLTFPILDYNKFQL